MSAALALVPADPRRIAEIDYPESDGAPVAETPVHFLAIVYLFLMLRERYKRLGPAYIGANMFLYFVQGDPRGVVSPDVYVVLGRPEEPERRVWKTWEEEDRVPDIVFEITSKSTKKEDLGTKMAIYAALGVREYVLFDPLGEYLFPRLQGYALKGGRYRRMFLDQGALKSEVLGLSLRPDHKILRAFEPDGTPLPIPEDKDDQILALQEAQAEQLAAHEAVLEAFAAELAERDAKLAERDAKLVDRDARLAEKDRRLAELEAELVALRQKLATAG